jgi:DNA-binding transcriptional regulator YdaS (Cro superfamily)
MSEAITTRGQQAGEKAAMSENTPQTPPRIRIDVPLGTPYREIRNSILLQAWQLAGTQLRAAIALGIRPETVSRNLRRAERNRAERNRAIGLSDHRAIGGESASPDSQSYAESVSRGTRMADIQVIEGGNQFSVPLLPFCEDDAEENDPASGINNDAEQDDLL